MQHTRHVSCAKHTQKCPAACRWITKRKKGVQLSEITLQQEHIQRTKSTFQRPPSYCAQRERGRKIRALRQPRTRGAHTEMRNRPSEEAVTMAWRVCANSLLIAHSQGKRRRKEAFSAVRVRGRGWAQRERVGEQHVHGSSSLQMAVCPLLFAMESAVDPELFLISFLAPASSSARTTCSKWCEEMV